MIIDKLYEKASGGDKVSERELFEYLTDRFRLFVQLRIKSRLDAEDIVQNALMTISGKYKNIEFQTSFAGWAYQVLQNKMRDYFKAQRRRDQKIESTDVQNQPTISQNLDETTRRQMLECLRKVGHANIRFSRILNLHYQGYSSDEICEKLKLKRNYFYVVLSRARVMLETCLEKGDVVDNE